MFLVQSSEQQLNALVLVAVFRWLLRGLDFVPAELFANAQKSNVSESGSDRIAKPLNITSNIKKAHREAVYGELLFRR